ncbi:MAG TPA: zf-HC2 domain-containing protein [Nitrospira sp.]|nr:zf-HC2 domain-containing protein [Nitrospira sp.]
MTKKKPTRKSRRPAPGHRHRPGEGRCLDILRQLSAYIDDELPSEICGELRRHLGACPNCEVFIASLRQTVTLCRHSRVPQLSAQDRAALRREILQAAQAR